MGFLRSCFLEEPEGILLLGRTYVAVHNFGRYVLLDVIPRLDRTKVYLQIWYKNTRISFYQHHTITSLYL